MRIMGLDLGTKNIGVAVSDETGILATGKETIRRTSDTEAVARIKKIVEESNASEIVIGLPINMNGTMGERAEDSIKFSRILEQQLKLSVKLWDERLSTSEVENVLLAADVTRKKRKKVIDKLAAQIILQSYLDSRK